MKQINIISPSAPAAGEVQSGMAGRIVAEGALELYNMRLERKGVASAVAEPHLCGFLPRKPVIADRMGGRTWFISAEDCEMRIEGYADDCGELTVSASEICTLPAAFASWASAGEYMVVRLVDGSLYYLRRKADRNGYDALGELPAMPDFSVEAAECVTLGTQADAVTFSGTLTDVRDVLPDAVRAQCSAAVARGWERLEEIARSDGRWIQPVAVRLVYRMCDNSVLAVSAPKVVSAAGYQQGGHVMLPLSGSSGSFTGTLGATVSASTYRLKISVAALPPAAWRDVIRNVEVWVAEAAGVVDTASEAGVVYNASGGHYLAVTLPMEASARSLAALCSMPMEHCGFVDAEETVVGRRALSSGFSPRIMANAVSQLNVRGVAGHGGFLHLAAAGRRYPSPAMPLAAGDQKIGWKVWVRIRGREECLLKGEGEATADAAHVSAMLMYPSRDAVEMTVQTIDSTGTVRRRSFPLLRAQWGEEASCFLDESLVEPELPVVDSAVDPGGEQAPLPQARCVFTMGRGNPFVVMGATEDCGGDIRCLEAQPVGGGAYTRQYLYCMHSEGISAITHDVSGRHTNCRPVATLRVASAGCVAQSERGVYVLSEAGSVALLRDARVDILLRNMAGYKGLAWSAAYDELFLLSSDPRSPAAVLLPGKSRHMGTRSIAPEGLLGGSDPMFMADALGGGWRLQLFEPQGSASMASHCRWVSEAFGVWAHGPAMLEVEWPSVPEDALVELLAEGSGGVLVTVLRQGAAVGSGRLMRLPVMLHSESAVPFDAELRFRVRVSGRFGTLGRIRLLSRSR